MRKPSEPRTGFVNPANNKTLYFLDVDTATGATCTGACLGVWPVLTPTAGSTAVANMTLATRSDGTGQQWAYEGHPLYNYAGDNGPNQTNGEGVPDFGGHWHVARPNADGDAASGWRRRWRRRLHGLLLRRCHAGERDGANSASNSSAGIGRP